VLEDLLQLDPLVAKTVYLDIIAQSLDKPQELAMVSALLNIIAQLVQKLIDQPPQDVLLVLNAHLVHLLHQYAKLEHIKIK
jgi:hypothetical protein